MPDSCWRAAFGRGPRESMADRGMRSRPRLPCPRSASILPSQPTGMSSFWRPTSRATSRTGTGRGCSCPAATSACRATGISTSRFTTLRSPAWVSGARGPTCWLSRTYSGTPRSGGTPWKRSWKRGRSSGATRISAASSRSPGFSGPDGPQGWPHTWAAALRACHADSWRALAGRAGAGLRALLENEGDLDEARLTCNVGLLASDPVNIDQFRRVAERLILDAVEPLEEHSRSAAGGS